MIKQYITRTIVILLLAFMHNLAFSQELEINNLCKQISPQDRQLAKINGIDIDKICSAQQESIDDTNEITAASSPIKISPRETISSKGDSTVSTVLTPVAVSGTKAENNPKALSPYGYDLLAGSPDTFAPILNVPVDPEYLLGPGDGINIMLFGKTNASFSLEIDRDGFLNIPEIGPVAISGLNFKEAKQMLTIRIANQIIGTNSSITMGNLRSMQVFVLGESFRPGAYTISSLSTVTHALLASGGITDIGSLRNIKVIRNDKEVALLDLYDLLLKGERSGDIRLQAGDVIFIPTAKNLVSISGQVLRPAIYEIKDNTSISDLLEMAGGMGPKSYKRIANLDRVRSDGFITVLDLDLTNESNLSMKLKAGDHLKINSIKEIKRDIVTLSGEVYYPTNLKWKEGMKISDILKTIETFPPRFDKNFAVLIRNELPDLNTEVIRVSLSEVMSGNNSAEDLYLEPGDDLKLFSFDSDRALFLSEAVANIIDQTQYPNLPEVITITGPVKSSGTYPLLDGMTLLDLIEFSGDFSPGFMNYDFALVASTSPFDGKKTIDKFNLKDVLMGKSENFLLSANDEIYLFGLNEDPSQRLQQLYSELKNSTSYDEPARLVYVNGSIKYAGTYPLTKSGLTVSELIKAAGGLIEDSYSITAELSSLDFSNPEKVNVFNKQIDISAILRGEADDIKLSPYDNLNIKQVPDFNDRKYVSIYGEVKFPGVYVIEENEDLLSVIKRAGGLAVTADKNASIFTRERLRIAERDQINELTGRLEDQIANQQLVDINSGRTVNDQTFDIQKEAVDRLNYSNPIGRLVINLPNILDRSDELILQDQDVLYIPTVRNEVTIIGEVYRPGSHLWSKKVSLRGFLEKAGGINEQADFKGIYIVRASGEVVVPNKGFFNIGNKNVLPGDTIVVPIDLSESEIDGIPLMATISRIIYELAIGAAAVKSFEN